MANVVSQIPETMDLDLYAGDGAAIKFTVLNAGVAFPLDGVLISQIKVTRADPEPLLTFGVDNSQLANGIVVIFLTGAQTASLISPTGRNFRGVWDLQYTATGAEPITLVQGKVKCNADVTR